MPIPRERSIDSTLAIVREGYPFIASRCRRMGSDLFLTRIMGQRTVCMHGPEAASIFYDEAKFRRGRAIPRRVVTSLFGKNAIHTHDDATHLSRKRAFLSLMTEANLARLIDGTADQWRRAVRRWEGRERVVLFEETQRLLTRAICDWCAVPLAEGEVADRARDMFRMIDAFGGVGPRMWRGKWARHRTEKWMTAVIEDARQGQLPAPPGTALHVWTHHRDPDGQLLDARTAAVELINVIRPTVAISWYVAFAALALHEHPDAAAAIRDEPLPAGSDDPSAPGGAGERADWFMQEVRRFYPFAPFVGALVRAPFEWCGHRFEPGTLVLLDLYGTNHDPHLWDAPETFRPERFRDWPGDPYAFMPQGGGPDTGHRCPGEWLTMHSATLAIHVLTRCMTYRLPPQDLSFSLRRMPTFPRSGVVLTDVRATPRLDQPMPRLPSAAAARHV